MEDNNLKVAIIGSRGIPNRYGGFEKFTEILSVALVEKGYKVFVSCENSGNELKNYKGVCLFYFPLKQPKSAVLRNLYELLYDVYSLFWASRHADIVYMLGYSAGIFFFIPKIFGKKLFVNPDGLEWKRAKFNLLIKFLLKFNERLMTFWADEIIADSKAIKCYLDSKYNIKSNFIPYGVFKHQNVSWNKEKLPKMLKDITPNDYWLVVSRLEPENNVHIILEAYLKSKTKKPLLVVGNYSSTKYEVSIKNMLIDKPKDKKIIFTGGIYDLETLNMIRQNCFAYLHGHSVGGTNPSLLEAMVMKNIIIAHDDEFNREVCDDACLYFKDSQQLKDKLDSIDSYYEDYLQMKELACVEVKKRYSWNKVFDQYESIFIAGK